VLLLVVVAGVAAHAAPDLNVQQGQFAQDPENPDFAGVVDFSNAVPGPDGSWCITKVKYVDHMENDQVKECWHQNVTQCHDTYITEFLPSQEQKCEESFWKSCKIDFKEMPFNYTLKQCHTPLIKKCDEYGSEYGAPAKTVCRTWFESECNTTYVESTSGDHKPNTWCQKKPRKICAPDNCNMVQGPEDCRDKVMVSTIQKPEEHCNLQPQRHCRLITKLVPHLTTKEVCKDIPKEICVMKLVNPHPVKKPIQLKWCTKKKPPSLPSYAPPPQYKPASYQQAQQPAYSPQPSYAPPSNYLPAASSAASNYLPAEDDFVDTSSAPVSFNVKREDSAAPFFVTVDGQEYPGALEGITDLQSIPLPIGPPNREQFRHVRHQSAADQRFTRHAKQPMAFPHMKPGHNPELRHSASINQVHVVRPDNKRAPQDVEKAPAENVLQKRVLTSSTASTPLSSSPIPTNGQATNQLPHQLAQQLPRRPGHSTNQQPHQASSSYRPKSFQPSTETILSSSTASSSVAGPPPTNMTPFTSTSSSSSSSSPNLSRGEPIARKPRHNQPTFSTSSSLRNYPGSIL